MVDAGSHGEVLSEGTVNTPVVSVIIPVHNAEDVVAEAVRSCLDQTLGDIEVLCIENNSTDGSVGVLEEVAALDQRVQVLDLGRPTRGPGAARNLGLHVARGEFIAFLDSDDKYTPNALEAMVSLLRSNDLDIAMCSIDTFTESRRHRSRCGYASFLPSLRDPESFTIEDLGPDLFGLRFAACNKVYRSDFLRENGLRFSEETFYEDLNFTFPAMIRARRMGYVPSVLYLNRKDRESATTHLRGDRVADAPKQFDRFRRFLDDEGLESLEDHFRAFEFRKLLNYLPHNDRASLPGFFDELREAASTMSESAVELVGEREQLARHQLVEAHDLVDFLLWSLWQERLSRQRLRRRLSRMKHRMARQSRRGLLGSLGAGMRSFAVRRARRLRRALRPVWPGPIPAALKRLVDPR